MKRRKQRGDAPLGRYAQYPEALSKDVLALLTAPEFRVWFALCMQNQHWCNGTGKLCRTVIREFHLGSQRVVTAATKKLLARNYIVRTRTSRQRVCALYGVIHLPLNLDALSKAGLTESQIRTVQARFAEIVCATNRGSANSATTSEAPSRRNDNRGSANPLEQPRALPQGKRITPFSAPLALPQGNTSKKSPCPVGHLESSSSSLPDSEIPSSSVGSSHVGT